MSSFKSKLLNGFAWRLCLYVSSFILNIFIASNFEAGQAGIFYLLLNNISFIVLFLSIGLDSAIAYFGSRKEMSNGTLLLLSITWTILAMLLLIVAYFLAIQIKLIPEHPLAPYILLNAGGMLLANCTASIFFSANDNKTPNIFLTIINILLIVIIPGNFFFHNILSNEDYTKAYLLVSAAPAIIFTTWLFVKYRKSSFAFPDKLLLKKLARFSLQAFVYSLFYTLLLRCDYWLVNYFCPPDELGNYLQATKIAQIILLIPTLASFSLFPLIVSHIHEDKKIDSKLLKLVSIYFYIGLVLCLGVIATGFWIFPWLYGDTFSKMYGSFALLSPGILMLAAAYPLSTYFSGQNMIRLKIRALAFSIVLLLLLDVFLIPAFDIYGAAIGSTIAYCFYFSYLFFYFKKGHNFKFTELLNIKTILKENIPALFKSQKL